MISKECARAINLKLSLFYRNLWNSDIGVELIKVFENRLTDEEYSKAVDRHMHDTERGNFPPIIADIERHIAAINLEAAAKKRAEQKKKDEERIEAAGVVLEKLDWRRLIREACEDRRLIENAVKERLHLRFEIAADREVLFHVMRTRQIALDRGEKFSPADAVKVGGAFMDEQNREDPGTRANVRRFQTHKKGGYLEPESPIPPKEG